MKIKNLLMVLAAGTFALTSCNNDEKGGPGTGDEEINFFLKVTRDGISRADTDSVNHNSTVDFGRGALLFANASGAIVRYERITDVYGTGTVTPDELESGKLFGGIDPSAVEVHIVGNVDFEGITSLPNLAALEQAPFIKDLKAQSDTDYGVSNATLYGTAKLVPVVPGSNTPADLAGANREAQVLLKPLIARFEIAKLTADVDSVGDFTLAGIYIDDFYYESSVIGNYVPGSFEDIQYSVGSSYLDYSRTTGYSDSDWYPILFDDGWDGTAVQGLGTAVDNSGINEIAPQKQVWAYNFYPDAARHPHIILHLTGVKVWDSGANSGLGDFVDYPNAIAGNGTAYLTVTGYKNATGTVNLEGGHIYRMKDLFFNIGDLRTEPEKPGEDKLDVWVEVELMKWQVVEIDPIFN